MKFKASCEGVAKFRRKKIRTRLYESGFITLYEVKEMFMEKTDESDREYVWSKNTVLENKIRVRQTKKGWFLYLPEPEKLQITTIAGVKAEPPIIGDITVFETNAFEQLIDELVKLRASLNNSLANVEHALCCNSGWYIRPCIVKAKKSGRKEERQDRKAKFHRWVDLSKGVQQVLALVEFEDGHVEQVQPDRIIFKEE
jgi:hypothetical protein